MKRVGQEAEQLEPGTMGTPEALPGGAPEPLDPETMGEAGTEEAGSAVETESPGADGEEAPQDEATIREAVEAEVTAKYEAQINELRSVKDKELAQRSKELQEFVVLEQQRQSLERQQADQLAATNPRQAYEMTKAQLDKIEADTQQRQAVEGWEKWVGDQAKEQGLDSSDPEVAAQLEKDLQGLLTAANYGQAAANKAALDWQVRVSLQGREAATKRVTQETEVRVRQEMEAEIPDLIQAGITKALVDLGISPEVGDGQSPPPAAEKSRADMSTRELKARGREALNLETEQLAAARMSMLSRNQRMAKDAPVVGLPQK